MSSDLRLVMSQAVAQLCHQVGFRRVSESALQLLCDVGEQYLQHLSLVIYRVASLCESEPHLDDGLLALRLLGENPQCLLKFMLEVGPNFVKPPRLLCGPRLGRIRLDIPPDDHPCLLERPVYIPRHLPVAGWQEEKGTNDLDSQASSGARTADRISASLATKSQSGVGSTASTSVHSRRPVWAGQISYQLTRISVDPVTKSLVEHAPPEKLPPPELPVTGDYFSSSFRSYPSDTSGSLRSLSPTPQQESMTTLSTLSSSYQGASDAAWAAALQAKPASRVLYVTKRFDPSAVTTTSSRLSNRFTGRSATSTAVGLSTLGGSSKKRMAPITARTMSIAKKPKLSGNSSVNTVAATAVAVTSKRRRRRSSVARKRPRKWRLRKASADSATTAAVVGQSEKVTVDAVADDSQWERKPTAEAGDHHQEKDAGDPMASNLYELRQSPVCSPAASSHTADPVGLAHCDSHVDSGSDKTPPAESPLAALRMRKSGFCEIDRNADDSAAVKAATVVDASLDIFRQRSGSPPSPPRSWLTTDLPVKSHRSCSISPTTTRAASPPPTLQASKSSEPTPLKSGLGKWNSSSADSVTPNAAVDRSAGKARAARSHSTLPQKRLKSRNRQVASRPSIISSLFGNPLRQKGSKITIDKPYEKPEAVLARRQKEQKLLSTLKASTASASTTDQSTVIDATSRTGPFASSRQTKRPKLVKRNSRTKTTTNQLSSPRPCDLPSDNAPLPSHRPSTTIDSPGSDGTEAMTDVDRAELLRIPSTTQDERKALSDDRVKLPFTSFSSSGDSFGKARASSLIFPASVVSRVRRRSASSSPLSSIDSTSSSLSSSSSTSCLSPIPLVKHNLVEVGPGSPRSSKTTAAGQQQLSSDRQGKASPESKPWPMVISATCPPPLLPISLATSASLRHLTPVTEPTPVFPPPTLYPVANEESCATVVNSQPPHHQISADSCNAGGGGGGLRIKIRFNGSVGGVSEVPITESPSRVLPLISSLSPSSSSSSSSSSSLSSSSTPVSPYIAPPRQIAAPGTGGSSSRNESVSLVSVVGDDSHGAGGGGGGRRRTGSASPTCATSSDAGMRTPLPSVKKNPKLVIRLGSGPTASSSSVSAPAADSDSCHSSSCFKPTPPAVSPRRRGKLDCEPPPSVALASGGVRTGAEGQQQPQQQSIQLTISRLAYRGGQLDSRASSSSSGTESLLSSGDDDEDEASFSASAWKLANYSTAAGARLPPPPCLERLPASAAVVGSSGGAGGAGSERDRRRPGGLPQLLPIHQPSSEGLGSPPHPSSDKARRGEKHRSSCSTSSTAAGCRPSQSTPSVRPVEPKAGKLPRARVDTVFTDDDDDDDDGGGGGGDGEPAIALGEGPKTLYDWPSLRIAGKKDTGSSSRPASVSTPSPAVPKATRPPIKARPPKRSRHQQPGSDQPQQSLSTQQLAFSSSNSSSGSLNTTSTTTKQQIVVASAGSSYFFDNNGQQIWLCPVCLLEDDGNLMIGCDSCDDWYHSTCLGLSVEPEVAQWFCPKCSGKPLASAVPVLQSVGFPATVPSTVAAGGPPSAAHLLPSLSHKQRSSARGGMTAVSGKEAKRRGAKRKA